MGFTPRLERLAIQLKTPARFFAGMVGRGGGPVGLAETTRAGDWAQHGVAAAGRAAAPALAAGRLVPSMAASLRLSMPVLDVPVLNRPPQHLAWSQVVLVHSRLAEGDRWPELLAALRAADQTRVAIAGGKRVVELVSDGARSALSLAIARKDFDAAQDELDRFAEVFDDHPGDYAAAHLLAQAHLDLGWARRGAAQPGGLPRGDWSAYLAHVATAEAVLDDFDPLEYLSPLLAGTRYLLVRGVDDGEALCRDWYEDWCDLDPTNWTAHATHAPHLLPHWFGTLRGFDPAARAAMARTRTDMGAAGYAMFYMAVADTLGDMPPTMDLALMVQGLRDFAADGGCQYRANIVAGVLAEFAHTLLQDGPGAGRSYALVHQALREVMTGTLREFHMTAWDNGDDSIRWALEQVFGAELTPESRVVAGPAGLTVAAA